MAYKRPLSQRQSSIILVGYIVLLIYWLPHALWDGKTILILLLSAFLVGYPIYKSLRQRRD